MVTDEINSNTVKVISNSLIESIQDLSKCKNLDSFYRYYLVYDDAWKTWNTMISFLSNNKEEEYKSYAYSLIENMKTISNVNGVSFDPQIKTVEEFYSLQTSTGRTFPFSAHEIIAWDKTQFMINDFLQSSVVILNRLDKLKK
jgi:hypothetical protein